MTLSGPRETPNRSLEYIRNLYNHVMEWYKSAETKAQVLLTLDGIFISVLAALVFRKPDELKAIANSFGEVTWVFIALMVSALLASVYSAIDCVRSRMMRKIDVERLLNNSKRSRLSSSVMWFFQIIAEHDTEQFVREVLSADDKLEIEALSSNLPKLSQNVVKKHNAINRGFVFAGLALAFFLLAGVSYVLSVRFS